MQCLEVDGDIKGLTGYNDWKNVFSITERSDTANTLI
jgi:hypothetical protein